MKIKKLRIAGFGPYRHEQKIDFERFDDDGIFLITGKTGAGKSSILDAICFALYASVPRFDGTESQLRSDHCEEGDPSLVELEFSLGDTDYRIYRTPKYERAKKRGGGTTVSQPDARLDIRDDSVTGDGPDAGWRSVAARPVDVGNELSRILPLKQDQFLQVILLAQNRFQRFLLAKTDDRRAILRTLFGTIRFERLETELIARRKELGDELDAVQKQIGGYAASIALHQAEAEPPAHPDREWFDNALAGVEHQGQEAATAAAAADARFTAAVTALNAEVETRRNQERRDAARAALARLDEESEAIELTRERVGAAQRAARVWPQIAALENARQSHSDAEQAEAHAWANREALVGAAAENGDQNGDRDGDQNGDRDGHQDGDQNGDRDGHQDGEQSNPSPSIEGEPAPARPTALPTTEQLKREIDSLLGRLGSLDSVLDDERSLPGLADELRTAEEALSTASAAEEAARSRRDALPGRLEALDIRLAEAALLAAREDEAAATLARLEAQQAAAREVAHLEPRLADAQREEAEARSVAEKATEDHDGLLDRRLAGHAAELAAGLAAGEPCLVCGSPEHPEPAQSDVPPVTEADINAARAALSIARADLDTAQAAVQRLTLSRAEARARAAGATGDELAIQIDDATGLLAQASEANRLRTALDAERTVLRGDIDRAAAEEETLRAQSAAAAAATTDVRSRQAGIIDRVAEHRDGWETVSARAERLRLELAAARTLHDARTTTRERRAAVDLAAAGVAAQLALDGFDDEAAAVSARLADADITRYEAEVRRHGEAIAASRAILAEPALAGLPEQPVDLTMVEDEHVAAGAARDEALAVASALVERISHVLGLVTEARAKLTASAALLTDQARVRDLAAVIHGEEPNTKRMRLETYVLAAQLEEIIAAANVRLRTMTGARYTLEHDDSVQYRGAQSGLGLAIRDEHTGRARPTHSLSGGETFLASLALALGLAETVSNQAGGIALDTLFVDEGFGSLDSETLETAMGTLDSLRAGGRTIGLISHVESMKEQIPAKLAIIVSNRGDSRILAP